MDVNLFLMESETIRNQLEEVGKRENIVSQDIEETARQSEEAKETYSRLEQELSDLETEMTSKREQLSQA